jgi:hypothetical protein
MRSVLIGSALVLVACEHARVGEPVNDRDEYLAEIVPSAREGLDSLPAEYQPVLRMMGRLIGTIWCDRGSPWRTQSDRLGTSEELVPLADAESILPPAAMSAVIVWQDEVDRGLEQWELGYLSQNPNPVDEGEDPQSEVAIAWQQTLLRERTAELGRVLQRIWPDHGASFTKLAQAVAPALENTEVLADCAGRRAAVAEVMAGWRQ